MENSTIIDQKYNLDIDVSDDCNQNHANALSIEYTGTDNESDNMSKYINQKNKSHKWSRADEKIIQKYIIKSLAYKTLYNESYFKYSFYYKLLIYPLVTISLISLGLQMITTTLINTGTIGDKDKILTIITTAVSVCVTILTYFKDKTSFYPMANGCRKAAVAFSEYADQLNTILTINKSYRADPLEVINAAQSDYKKLMKMYSEYEIPSNVYKSFVEKNKNNAMVIDIATTGTDNFSFYDGTLEKNIIINKFLESVEAIREKNIPDSHVIEIEN
jgi:hypothetical protein